MPSVPAQDFGARTKWILKALIAKLLSSCLYPTADFSRCAMLSVVDKFQPRGQGQQGDSKVVRCQDKFFYSDLWFYVPFVFALAL